jgi:hypothetical protein
MVKRLTIALALVAALSTTANAWSSDNDPLKAFLMFTLYQNACGLDPTDIIDATTYNVMTAMAAQRSEAQRHQIRDEALAEIKMLINARGLPTFCAVYGREATPAIRKLVNALRGVR